MFNLLLKFQRFLNKRKGKIWLLFRATDFKSLMYPCLIFCRILGIFPYKIDTSNIKACKPCYILSTIIIYIICVCDVINLLDVNTYKNIAFKSTQRLLEHNCFYILGCFITIITFIMNGPRMRLLQTILEFSLKLPPKSYKNLYLD